MKFEDTIIAPATLPGTGAISLLRISGPSALRIADSLVKFRNGNASSSPGGRVKFGTISDGTDVVDEVLASIFRAPHSYTGEDAVEISCHASSYIVSEIVSLAVKAGARLALPGEFTQRAFINGKMDLSQAEAVADVIASDDKASHDTAFSQLKGGISSELASLRAQLLEMTSLLELELDFSEEEVEFADRGRLTSLLDAAIRHVRSLASSFRLGNAVKNGIPVAITGAANAGKSTLLNRILGDERAIVSSVPGTTRDTIEECFNVDGIKYRFIDTAGIRSSEDEIEKLGILRSFDSVSKAEVVIVVVDALLPDFDSLAGIFSHIDFSRQRVIVAVNKTDKIPSAAPQEGASESNQAANSLVMLKNKVVALAGCEPLGQDSLCFARISAKQGTGVTEMLSGMSAREKKRLASPSSSVTITNLRHYEALSTALTQLQSARSALLSGLSSELVSEDLRTALRTLGSITGEISTDEVLGEIFGRFCIGK